MTGASQIISRYIKSTFQGSWPEFTEAPLKQNTVLRTMRFGVITMIKQKGRHILPQSCQLHISRGDIST